MTIDTPKPNSAVPGSFTLHGWALSEWSPGTASGVSAVHLWAYPSAGGPPLFLGAARIDDRRPDVARAFGGRFERSGFHVTVTGLAAGTYDLVAFVFNATSRTFTDRRVVRVTVQ
jgi:hypothetical protein